MYDRIGERMKVGTSLFHSVIESHTIYSMLVPCRSFDHLWDLLSLETTLSEATDCWMWIRISILSMFFYNFLLFTSSLIHHTANCQCYCYELNFLCCLSCFSLICFCLSSSNLDFSSFNLSSFSSLVWIIKVWPLIQNENSDHKLHPTFRWKLICFIPVTLVPIEELFVFVFMKVAKA